MSKYSKFENIDAIVFDVDGTLYDKNQEKDSRIGSIQTAHDFFRFNAFKMIEQGIKIELIPEILINQYFDLNSKNNLKNNVELIDAQLIKKYEQHLKKYGSNGKVFSERFGTNSNFLHYLLSHIQFENILGENKMLVQTVNNLKKNHELGILTTEVYSTAKKVIGLIGLDLTDFQMKTGDKYGILCSENVPNKKPSPDGFIKLKEIYNSNEIIYVGDHLVKDIKTAIDNNIHAVQVLNNNQSPQQTKKEIKSKTYSFPTIGRIHQLDYLF